MTYFTPERKEQLIQHMMKAVDCTRAQARDYLIAEEWIISDAIISYRGDMKTESKVETIEEKFVGMVKVGGEQFAEFRNVVI